MNPNEIRQAICFDGLAVREAFEELLKSLPRKDTSKYTREDNPTEYSWLDGYDELEIEALRKIFSENDTLQARDWFLEGMEKFREDTQSNFLHNQYGSSGEFFDLYGVKFQQGQPSVDRVVEFMKNDEWDWMDEEEYIDWDEIFPCSMHRTQDMEFIELKKQHQPDGSVLHYLLHGTIIEFGSCLAMREMNQKGAFDFVGDRRIPYICSFVDSPEYIAMLSRDGWADFCVVPTGNYWK